MTLDNKLDSKMHREIWQEYCGFLDISLSEYMNIQKRLLLEQLELLSKCKLGKRIIGNEPITSIAEFKERVPLTNYDDYADILLQKDESALPAKPVIWIQTTWEGGNHPIKVAPYSESMIKTHRSNFLACMLLATSNKKGEFSLRKNDRFLYGMATLPYLTGIVPHVLKGELSVQFLPPTEKAAEMTFSQRNREGYTLGLQKGLDLCFGLGSVVAKMGETFSSGSSSNGFPARTPKMAFRLLKAWYKSKTNHTPILPKDVWNLKGLMYAGTDCACFKEKIQHYWGITPHEVFGGTEPTIIGTETWTHSGTILFPDVCFYEFIPLSEMHQNMDDPTYRPRTHLLDELTPGMHYELVITSFKGGAFVRYRVGDIFKFLTYKDTASGLDLPHFKYVDRIPSVIDIAGFTRITENTINAAIELSGLSLENWFALKEYDDEKRPFMNLYIEPGDKQRFGAMAGEIIKEQLSIYFKYIDNDYKDLKKILGIDPLQITLIPNGSIARYNEKTARILTRMNPSQLDVVEFRHFIEKKGR